jgi:hypothetical protein
MLAMKWKEMMSDWVTVVKMDEMMDKQTAEQMAAMVLQMAE